MHRFLAFLVIAVATVCTHAAAAESARPPLDAMDPAQVKLGGEIGRRIDLTIRKNILAIDVENQFLAPFRRKQSTLFAYVGIGKLIDAAVNFAYYTRDPKVIALKDHLINELLATQLDDGYIGAFPAGSRLRDVFDEHEIAYILHALVDNYRRFHDQRSLDAARKLADYFVKSYKDAVVGRDPQLICKIDIERAMIALSEASDDARYRDYIVQRENPAGWHSPIDVVNDGKYSSGDGHAYTFMNNCLAQLDLYRQQPDASLLGQSHRVIDYLTQDDGLMITGTCSLTERFRNNQETRGDVGESCATAYLIRLCHYLLQLENQTLYADLMERAIYNALFAAQSPDGRQLRYYTAIDGPRAYYPNDTYCCPNNWRRIVAELPEMVYYRTADGGALVNLYTASTANVPLADDLSVRLQQETDYPNSGRVVLRVDPSRSAAFPLKLRIPRWCESAAISVNGKPAAEPVVSGRWFEIRRDWNPGDRVELNMPMPWRLVQGRKQQAGKAAVMRGPLVFSLSRALNPGLEKIDLGQLKLDPASFGDPVPDGTVRPDGLACPVRALSSDPNAGDSSARSLWLTEYPDPTAEATYFLTAAPAAAVPDELCVPKPPTPAHPDK